MFRSSNIGGKSIGRVIDLQEILIDPKHNVNAFELGTIFRTIKVRDSVKKRRSVAFRLLGIRTEITAGRAKQRSAKVRVFSAVDDIMVAACLLLLLRGWKHC